MPSPLPLLPEDIRLGLETFLIITWGGGAISIWWVEAGNAAYHRNVPMKKNDLAPRVHSVKVEKPTVNQARKRGTFFSSGYNFKQWTWLLTPPEWGDSQRNEAAWGPEQVLTLL